MAEMEDLLLIDERLWVLAAPTGVAVYDFPFDRFLPCRRPFRRPDRLIAVARVGAPPNYDRFYEERAAEGVTLIHDTATHRRCSELPGWYPLLHDITPRSLWFDAPPEPQVVEDALGWPIFMKGTRQTSRHRRHLAIVDGPDAFRRAVAEYREDPMLHWQGVACREFVPLRLVEDVEPDRIPSAFEFRTFFWRGRLVGFGRYWWAGKDYAPTPDEKAAAVALAQEAADRVNVPFLVVDVAQRADGRWFVIECNDGQESGYAGIPPLPLWRHILDLERSLQPSVDEGSP